MTIYNEVESLMESGQYQRATALVRKHLDFIIKGVHFEYDTMPLWNDDTPRHIFKIQIKRGRKSMSFFFGQSTAEGSNYPSTYDVIACLQKYDVGTFQDFCEHRWYDEYDKNSKKVYKAIVKEFKNLSRLFNEDELELLSLIY